MSLKRINAGVARAVNNVGKGGYAAPSSGKVNMDLVYGAKAWAEWEIARAICGEIDPGEVLKACGRLQMRHFGGRNKNYDHAADEALLRDFLQMQAVA